MVCDFCSDENPIVMFTIPAGGTTSAYMDNGIVPAVVTHIDDGQWAACEKCKADILKMRDMSVRYVAGTASLEQVQEPMLDMGMRSLDKFKMRMPDMPEPLMVITISEMHSIFWQRYAGTDPVEIPEAERVA